MCVLLCLVRTLGSENLVRTHCLQGLLLLAEANIWWSWWSTNQNKMSPLLPFKHLSWMSPLLPFNNLSWIALEERRYYARRYYEEY